MRGYTTREAADLLGMAPAKIRRFARSGVLSSRRPGKHYLFSFEDIVLLRAANELIRNDIPERQIYRSLLRLRERLPKDRSLSSVRIVAEGRDVLVRENTAAWNPVSGQFSFSFTVQEMAGKVAPLVRESVDTAQDEDLGSEDWYDLALELELISALDEAKSAYDMSLKKNPDNADAHVNLGRLLQLDGDNERAEGHYRDALLIDPEHATAAFNLGTVLEEKGENDAAIKSYRRALEVSPNLADAHFNLAQLYEDLGNRIAAMRHLRKYKGLTRDQR